MPGDMGLPRPDPECTESEDSEEFEVDLCFLPPNSFIVPPSSPLLNFVSGWGTNITDTQLSSESMDVSLWILPSLLEESDPVSPFDNFLSLSGMKFKHLGTLHVQIWQTICCLDLILDILFYIFKIFQLQR